jgi:hypothetical protein
VKVVNSLEKGLSKSRNLALKIATSNWCLIADDDLVYLKDFETIIFSGIKQYDSSGVIVFKSLVEIDVSRRIFPVNSKKKLNSFEKFDVASFEMLLNRTHKQAVFFNENFGLGSDVFLFGEEALLMYDYGIEQKNVSYYNKAIVCHPKESTGTLYDHPLRYYTKGGILKYSYPKLFRVWIFIQLFFDLKQNKIKISDVSKNYSEAIKGVKKLKEITNAEN